MNYTIEWASSAVKDLERLPLDVQKRVIVKLDSITENPFRFLEHFEGEYYKLRIGEYRVLIDLDFDNKKIVIQVLDKRGRIYK